MDTPAERAPWLSWLKRLSSKQEIPSSNLGGASSFLTNPTVKLKATGKVLLLTFCPRYKIQIKAKQTVRQNAATRDRTGDL